jgi:hypothetical protein
MSDDDPPDLEQVTLWGCLAGAAPRRPTAPPAACLCSTRGDRPSCASG